MIEKLCVTYFIYGFTLEITFIYHKGKSGGEILQTKVTVYLEMFKRHRYLAFKFRILSFSLLWCLA